MCGRGTILCGRSKRAKVCAIRGMKRERTVLRNERKLSKHTTMHVAGRRGRNKRQYRTESRDGEKTYRKKSMSLRYGEQDREKNERESQRRM